MTNQLSKSNQIVGAEGERQVAAFLVAKGYTLIRQNWHLAGGEIDLLMWDETGTLVVVEVKSRQSTIFTQPQSNITVTKLKTLSRLAHAVSDRYPNTNVRVDVVECNTTTSEINHLKDVLN